MDTNNNNQPYEIRRFHDLYFHGLPLLPKQKSVVAALGIPWVLMGLFLCIYPQIHVEGIERIQALVASVVFSTLLLWAFSIVKSPLIDTTEPAIEANKKLKEELRVEALKQVQTYQTFTHQQERVRGQVQKILQDPELDQWTIKGIHEGLHRPHRKRLEQWVQSYHEEKNQK